MFSSRYEALAWFLLEDFHSASPALPSLSLCFSLPGLSLSASVSLILILFLATFVAPCPAFALRLPLCRFSPRYSWYPPLPYHVSRLPPTPPQTDLEKPKQRGMSKEIVDTRFCSTPLRNTSRGSRKSIFLERCRSRADRNARRNVVSAENCARTERYSNDRVYSKGTSMNVVINTVTRGRSFGRSTRYKELQGAVSWH